MNRAQRYGASRYNHPPRWDVMERGSGNGTDESWCRFRQRVDPSNSWSGIFLNPVPGRFASGSRPAASVIAMLSRSSALFPGIKFPRAPGHEVVGTIDAVGTGVTGWKKDARVGVGWHGGHCGQCRVLPTRRFHHLRRVASARHPLRRRLCRLHDRSGRGTRLDPRRIDFRRCRAAALRRHHDLQFVAQQRRAGRRPRCHSRHRWAGAPGRAVRGEDGMQYRRDCPRRRQACLRARTRRAPLYRQHRAGRGGRTR